MREKYQVSNIMLQVTGIMLNVQDYRLYVHELGCKNQVTGISLQV